MQDKYAPKPDSYYILEDQGLDGEYVHEITKELFHELLPFKNELNDPDAEWTEEIEELVDKMWTELSKTQFPEEDFRQHEIDMLEKQDRIIKVSIY